MVMAMARYTALIRTALAHLHMDAVHVDDGVNQLQRPGFDLVGHCNGDLGNQPGRYLGAVYLFEVDLYLAIPSCHGRTVR